MANATTIYDPDGDYGGFAGWRFHCLARANYAQVNPTTLNGQRR